MQRAGGARDTGGVSCQPSKPAKSSQLPFLCWKGVLVQEFGRSFGRSDGSCHDTVSVVGRRRRKREPYFPRRTGVRRDLLVPLCCLLTCCRWLHGPVRELVRIYESVAACLTDYMKTMCSAWRKHLVATSVVGQLSKNLLQRKSLLQIAFEDQLGSRCIAKAVTPR